MTNVSSGANVRKRSPASKGPRFSQLIYRITVYSLDSNDYMDRSLAKQEIYLDVKEARIAVPD